MKRESKYTNRKITLNVFGVELRLDLEEGGRVLHVGGYGSENAKIDGKEYHIRASLVRRVGEGYITARTEGGNEAGHGLTVSEWGTRNYSQAGKKVKDRVRDALLAAVNAWAQANGALLRSAELEAINNEIVSAERDVASLRSKLEQAEKALAGLVEFERLELAKEGK